MAWLPLLGQSRFLCLRLQVIIQTDDIAAVTAALTVRHQIAQSIRRRRYHFYNFTQLLSSTNKTKIIFIWKNIKDKISHKLLYHVCHQIQLWLMMQRNQDRYSHWVTNSFRAFLGGISTFTGFCCRYWLGSGIVGLPFVDSGLEILMPDWSKQGASRPYSYQF